MKNVLILVMVLCWLFSLTGAASALIVIGFEAEEGFYGADSITAPFETIADPMASGGLAVGTNESVGDSNNNVPTTGIAVYSFYAPAGRYYVLGKIRSDTSDSLWVRIADENGNSVDDNVGNAAAEPDWLNYDNIHIPAGGSRTPEYRWDVVHSTDDGQRQARFDLPEDGWYTLEVARREDGVYFDGWVITDALGIDQRVMPMDHIPGAQGPATIPANEATGVGINDRVLSWEAIDGVTYDVSMGTSPAILTTLGSVTAEGDTASFDLSPWFPFGMQPDSTWYWQLDIDGRTLATMSFSTMSTKPVIVSQPDALIQLGPNCSAVLEVVATSGHDDNGPALSYQWSDGNGIIADASDSTYITDVPGTYTCLVSNGTAADDKTTDPAALVPTTHLAFLSGFSSTDVGTPGQAGFADSIDGSGKITVAGGGSDIWGNSDNCHFAYVEHSGDGEWIVRITDMYNPNNARDMDQWVKGGIMARQNTDGGSQNSGMLISWQHGTTFQRRETAAGTSQSTRDEGTRAAMERPHQWLKLVRQGNTFYGYYALDDGGKPGTWFTDRADGYVVNMTDPILVGLAVTAHNDGRLGACDFDSLGGDFGSTWAVVPHGPDPIVPQNPAGPVVISWTHSPVAVPPCGNVTYDFILETSAAAASDAAAVPLVADTTDMQVELTDLAEATDYYYRIDVKSDDGIERGEVQLLRTVRVTPQTVTDVALWSMGDLGDEVTLTYEAASPGGEPVAYSWHIVTPGDANGIDLGINSSQLTLTIDETTVANQYFCKSYNMYGEGESSATANLGIKTQIGYWPFEEKVADPNGTAVTDIINGNNALLYGIIEPNLVEGIVGSAIDLDGVTQWADVQLTPSELGINGNHPRTVSAWVYTRVFNDGGIYDMGSRSNGQDFCLRTENESHDGHTSGDDAALGDHGWRVQHWGSAFDYNFNTLTAAPTDPNSPWNFTTPVEAFPSKDAWVYFVHTHDGETMRIYGNGQLIIEVPRTFDTGDDITFRIGAYGQPGVDTITGIPLVGSYFGGLIDEVKLYNYAKDAGTIAQEYVAQMPGAVICTEFSPLDIDGDCDVTLIDFAYWAQFWGQCGLVDCE